MLTPDYLDQLPASVVDLYIQAEMDILADMARRIAKLGRITDATKWQMERLKAIGAEYEYIQQTLQSYLGITQGELQALLAQAGEDTLLYDDRIYRAAGFTPEALANSPELQQILASGLENTAGLFVNLTGTTASAGQQQFIAALDRAWMQMMSGAFSYQEAIKMAIKELSRKGLASIRYDSGHVDHMDVAVRRAVLTGIGQACGRLGLARAQELGADIMELTAHAGARPSHAAWQGKLVSLSGRDGYLSLDSIGYGSGDGFKGWNCRHDWFPYFPGLSESAYRREDLDALNKAAVPYNGRDIPLYDATQEQRRIERNIRKWKREQATMEAAGLDPGEARGKVRQWQAAQRDFINQTGLTRDYFRERAGKQNK